MSRLEDLLEKVRAYHPKVDEDLLRRAYEYCEAAHRDQMRSSGEPYLIHPIAVAMILPSPHQRAAARRDVHDVAALAQRVARYPLPLTA